MSDHCSLAELGSCCCKCRHLAAIHYHCTTQPRPVDPTTQKEMPNCVCDIQKTDWNGKPNYACTAFLHGGGKPGEIGRIHDHWGMHGMCEMFHERP